MSEALEAYRRAASRGIWLDIANSQMTSKERAMAISWRYQGITIARAKRGEYEQAIRFAGFIINERIRESAMAQVYQIKNRARFDTKSKPANNPKPTLRSTSSQGHGNRPKPQPTQTRLLPEANAYFRQSA